MSDTWTCLTCMTVHHSAAAYTTCQQAHREADPVQQAVDDYILMERKARAWDDLYAVAVVERWTKVLALMDMKVTPVTPPGR